MPLHSSLCQKFFLGRWCRPSWSWCEATSILILSLFSSCPFYLLPLMFPYSSSFGIRANSSWTCYHIDSTISYNKSGNINFNGACHILCPPGMSHLSQRRFMAARNNSAMGTITPATLLQWKHPLLHHPRQERPRVELIFPLGEHVSLTINSPPSPPPH